MLKRTILPTLKMAQSVLDRDQVGFLILYVTNRCNFRCDFCFYYAEIEKGRKPNELSLEEIARISEKLGPLVQLSLTGGEPFIREDLAGITDLFVRNNNVTYLTIPTNAWLTTRIVSYLETVLPRHPQTNFRIVFSIDGIGDEHDRNRSMKGSYKRIQESYAAVSPLRARYPNLVLDANSIFSANTEDRILDIVRHLHEHFRFDNLSITYARGEIPNPELKKTSHDNYINVNHYLESIERTEEKRLLYPLWRGVRDISRENLIRTVFNDEFVTPCVAGRKLLVISETGEVRPCEILTQSMGNVRDFDYDISKIVTRPESRDLTKWIEDTKCKCSFECALSANVVWNVSMYPRLARAAIKNIG